MFSTGEKAQTRKQTKETNPPLVYCKEKSEFVVLGFQGLLTLISEDPIYVKAMNSCLYIKSYNCAAIDGYLANNYSNYSSW